MWEWELLLLAGEVSLWLYRIFQFENFAQTKKRVLTREVDDGAQVGNFIVHCSYYGFLPLYSLVGLSLFTSPMFQGVLWVSVLLDSSAEDVISFDLLSESCDPSYSPVVVFGLLQHENKVVLVCFQS